MTPIPNPYIESGWPTGPIVIPSASFPPCPSPCQGVPAATTAPSGQPDSYQSQYLDPQIIGNAIEAGPLIQGPCPGGVAGSAGSNLGTFPNVLNEAAAFYTLALETYLTKGADTEALSAATKDFDVAMTGGNEPGMCHPIYDWAEATET
ncbi:MAG TPA: hypothetical protein VMF61_09595, partial [Candidatus Acidoferrales bacterium]|nr:hypothetical protein [Candidatus Acidoferrales bacterium]